MWFKEKPNFVNDGMKGEKPKINKFGNKNKYGKTFVPATFCESSIGHPAMAITLGVSPATSLDKREPIRR